MPPLSLCLRLFFWVFYRFLRFLAAGLIPGFLLLPSDLLLVGYCAVLVVAARIFSVVAVHFFSCCCYYPSN
jgi:hypothetical protein